MRYTTRPGSCLSTEDVTITRFASRSAPSSLIIAPANIEDTGFDSTDMLDWSGTDLQ